MKTVVLALVVAATALSGCGRVSESRLNPMNWFGGSRDEAPTLGPTQTSVDNRALVTQVTELSIEQTSTGALVRATGMMPTAGWWDPGLVAENHGRPVDGTLTLRFVAAAPSEPVVAANDQARRLIAVYPINIAILETISDIVVTGAENSRRARR